MSAALSPRPTVDELPSRLGLSQLNYSRVLSALIVTLGAIALFLRAVVIPRVLEDSTTPVETYLSIAAPMLGGLAALVAATRQRTGIAGVILTVTLLIGAVITVNDQARTLLGSLGLVTAALLTGSRFFIIAMGSAAGFHVFEQINMVTQQNIPLNDQRIGLIVSGVTMLVLGGVFRYVYGIASRTADDSETAFQRLSAVASIGRETGLILDLPTLYSQSVDRIKDAFGFYHVQIFLVDEQRTYANLVASTDEAGRRLLARNHRLAVGSDSVIGRVTLANEIVLISDTETEAGHAPNPLLPDTRAELALPMVMQVGGESRVIGALDVQSVAPNAFLPTDIQALQALANQLAVSIRNAELFETQESNIRTNQRLFEEARSNLSEIERLNRQLTRQAWDSFMMSNPDFVGATASDDGVVEHAEWTDLMLEACRTGQLTEARMPDGVQVLASPILLRDQVIGAIEVVGGDNLSLDVRAAVSGISEMLAINLENQRLLEESQAASAQEYRINQVVSKFQEAETIDELLQITLSELAQTLEAEGGSIRVGLTPAGASVRQPRN